MFENLRLKYLRLQDCIKKNILRLIFENLCKDEKESFGYNFFLEVENSNISILKMGDNLSGIGFFIVKK